MPKEDNPKNDTNLSSFGEKVSYLPFYAPPAHPDDDTIDLVELVQTLWKRRKLIIIITLLSLLGAGIYVVGFHFFGKKVYETDAARELTRYVLSDKEFASRAVEAKAAPEEGRAALQLDGEIDARQFLGRGKSQAVLDQTYTQGGAPLSLDEVRELLNRNR